MGRNGQYPSFSFHTMALIPLAYLPETRLTSKGLVDCRTFEFLDLVVN